MNDGDADDDVDDDGALADGLTERAARSDAVDPLAGKRDEFDLAPEMAYLDGNSLGAPPRSVAPRLAGVIAEQWGSRLIRSWSEGWWEVPERVGDRVGALIGAAPGQVVVGDSTSVNLFKALVAAVRMNPDRGELLVDAGTFPTDAYVADSVARLTGVTVRRLPVGELAAASGANTAAVLLNHVDYLTGALVDLPSTTSAVRGTGAIAVWDLCHSVGALPVDLDGAGVDLAVGCTYKFLNGGPGAPAFIYVPRHRQAEFDQPLSGWHGHRDPFGMEPGYVPAPGVTKARVGTPDILSMLALDAALDVWDDVEMTDVRAKSLALGDFFLDCLGELVPDARVLSPLGATRGNQISVAVPGAEAALRVLAEHDVLADFRPPDVLRFGMAGLYTRFVDVLRAAEVLATLHKGR